jgi:hypothetical protein
MKRLLLLPFFLTILACSAQAVHQVDVSVYHGQTYVTCTNKLDSSHLNYLESQKADYKSSIIETVTISNITDVEGKRWSVNQNEWTNFVCTKQLIP